MPLIFWDSQGVIKIDYLKQGHTINRAYYAGDFVPASWESMYLSCCPSCLGCSASCSSYLSCCSKARAVLHLVLQNLGAVAAPRAVLRLLLHNLAGFKAPRAVQQ